MNTIYSNFHRIKYLAVGPTAGKTVMLIKHLVRMMTRSFKSVTGNICAFLTKPVSLTTQIYSGLGDPGCLRVFNSLAASQV